MKLKLNKEAQKARDNSEFVEGVVSNDFWYDLTKGGYLRFTDLLSDKDQIAELKKAVKLLQQFEALCDELVESP